MATKQTIGTIDPHARNPTYEQAYASTWFWNYTTLAGRFREWWKLKHHVIRRAGLVPGSRVLEIASGQGYHVHALARMGYRVTGVDISPAGIEFARRQFPGDDFRLIDAAEPMPFPPESFDLVWSHGAGFFHYCITDRATETIVRDHLRYVKPGGHYMVMIATDLSGSRPTAPQDPWAFEWNHTLKDLRAILTAHGADVAVDWFPVRRWIVGPRASNGSGYGVAVVRKPERSR